MQSRGTATHTPSLAALQAPGGGSHQSPLSQVTPVVPPQAWPRVTAWAGAPTMMDTAASAETINAAIFIGNSYGLLPPAGTLPSSRALRKAQAVTHAGSGTPAIVLLPHRFLVSRPAPGVGLRDAIVASAACRSRRARCVERLDRTGFCLDRGGVSACAHAGVGPDGAP